MGGPAIGIDLGTTYSCVAVWHHNQVEIIANNQGNRITPSYVAFTQEECIIGDEAFKQASFNPLNTVFDAKRLIGRQYSDENVERNMKLWPFKVVLGEGEKAMIAVNYRGQEKLFAPEQISAMILAKMKKVAEIFLGEAVSNAVVTVPAYFNDSQRLDTKNAGLIAGLKVMKIINEPTAAAIAYGFNKKVQNCPLHKVILIFDLGGGTFDVSILAIDEGNFQVKATAGDANLGGEDFDNNMVKHFINEFQLKYQKDMMGNPRSLRRLRTACESAKMTLSSIYYTNIDIELLCDGVDFHASITRAKFEELNLNLFKKCMENLEKCLSDAKMVKVDIDEVVLIGGSTQIPKIQQLLKEFFDGKELRQGINPDEAVAKGVAIQAAILSGESYIGELKELQLHDVTPLSVGIGVNHSGEEMKVIIPRNSSIPTHKESIFTTFYDNRSSLLLEVFEGERPLTRDNNLLGKFWLKGIPPTPRGVPKVLVCFDIDENGILNVTTQEMETGRKEHICITNEKESLTRCEMEAMVVKAQIFKACDEEVRRKLEAKHTFENLVYKMRNRLRDVKILSTLRDEDELRIEETIAEAIEWVGSSVQVRKVEELEEKLKEVEIICKPIVERGERGQDHMQIHR